MKEDFDALFKQAHAEGMEAARNCIPTPMVVQQHTDMMNDSSPVAKSWVVNDGPCGFAWINIRPGTCSAARWAKKNWGARAAYGGGMEIWVHEFNQSITRKEAYARAFAKILCAAGIKAYSGSRLD